ncbi:MAG: cytochrome P450 [bacterium]|nr:cytochrome P450 [bacterium]
MNTTDVDITSTTYTENPYKWTNLLREKGNIHYLDKNQSWLIIGFSECVHILNHPELFSSEGKHQFDPILLNCDPPKHTYHKRILSGDGSMFSNDRIDSLLERNKQICEAQFNRLSNNNRFDFLNDFALPYSSLVILAMLGIETSNNKDLLEWSKEAVSTKSVQNRDQAMLNWMKLFPLVSSWVEEAYNNPQKRGIPEFIFHPNAQNYFTKDQIINLVKILLLGGNETTPTLASSALYHLICNNEQMIKLRADPNLFESFLNEVLRYYAPTQIIARTTLIDTSIEGQFIPKNSLINVAIGAANRDPKYFEQPNDFNLNRPKGRILSFGHGAHHCIGASLAKQETRLIFEELFRRFKNIGLPDDFKPEYRHSTHIRGLVSLPIIVS